MIELVVDRCKIKTTTQLTIFKKKKKKIIIITRAFIKKFNGFRAGLVVEGPRFSSDVGSVFSPPSPGT